MSSMHDALIDGMLALLRALRRERRKQLLVVGIALLAALLLGYAASQTPDTPLLSLLAVLGMTSGVVGLRLLRDVLRQRRTEDHPLFRCLHHRPQSVVWVYVLRVEVMPFGVQLWNEDTLILRLDDGTMHELRARPDEMQRLETCLHQLLPHATFGYDASFETLYQIDPALLRK